MIWLSWRQFRAQALVGGVALVLIAVYLAFIGVGISNSHDSYLSRCVDSGNCLDAMSRFQDDFRTKLLILAALFALIPMLIGMFWGAPLIAKEIEAGTHRLVWNQSVTRRHWLTVKLLFVGLAAVAATGVVSAMLTWAASPYDKVADDRFSTIVFGARNIAPLAYTALAFVLGAIIGMLVRRTITAMALSILLFTLFQFLMPNVIRPHLMAPLHVTTPMTADAINAATGLGGLGSRAVIKGLTIPKAWITDTSELLTAEGQPLDSGTFNDCLMRPPKTGASGTFGDAAVCLGALNLHVNVSYQPDSRYWTFQLLEAAVYLALSGLLAAFGLWRVERQLN